MMSLKNNVYFALGSFQEQLMGNVQKIEILSGNDDQVEDGLECSLKSTPRIATPPLPTSHFSSIAPKQTLTQTTPPIHKSPFGFQEQPINVSLNVLQTPPLGYQNQPIQLGHDVSNDNAIEQKIQIV
jgi:hypothetical protein